MKSNFKKQSGKPILGQKSDHTFGKTLKFTAQPLVTVAGEITDLQLADKKLATRIKSLETQLADTTAEKAAGLLRHAELSRELDRLSRI